jgi:hypothetical protein
MKRPRANFESPSAKSAKSAAPGESPSAKSAKSAAMTEKDEAVGISADCKLDEFWQNGSNHGWEKGYGEGWKTGYASGQNDGWQDGYNKRSEKATRSVRGIGIQASFKQIQANKRSKEKKAHGMQVAKKTSIQTAPPYDVGLMKGSAMEAEKAFDSGQEVGWKTGYSVKRALAVIWADAEMGEPEGPAVEEKGSEEDEDIEEPEKQEQEAEKPEPELETPDAASNRAGSSNGQAAAAVPSYYHPNQLKELVKLGVLTEQEVKEYKDAMNARNSLNKGNTGIKKLATHHRFALAKQVIDSKTQTATLSDKIDEAATWHQRWKRLTRGLRRRRRTACRLPRKRLSKRPHLTMCR